MRGRTKTLTGVVVAVAVLVAAAAYVATRLRPAIAATIEQYGERATGTQVDIGSVAISLGDSRGTVSDLVVGNPPGYETEYALRIGAIDVVIDVPSLARDPIVLRDVTLTDATLNAEQHGLSSNLTEILDHVNGGASSGEPEPTADAGRKLVIDRFRLARGHIAVTSEALAKPESIDLGEVVVNDIGKAEGGVTFSEATERLLSPVLAAARDAVRERLGDAAAGAAKRKLEDAARKRLEELAPKD
jgi:hypothetical protein